MWTFGCLLRRSLRLLPATVCGWIAHISILARFQFQFLLGHVVYLIMKPILFVEGSDYLYWCELDTLQTMPLLNVDRLMTNEGKAEKLLSTLDSYTDDL
jgi:hypothetical protein